VGSTLHAEVELPAKAEALMPGDAANDRAAKCEHDQRRRGGQSGIWPRCFSLSWFYPGRSWNTPSRRSGGTPASAWAAFLLARLGAQTYVLAVLADSGLPRRWRCRRPISIASMGAAGQAARHGQEAASGGATSGAVGRSRYWPNSTPLTDIRSLVCSSLVLAFRQKAGAAMPVAAPEGNRPLRPITRTAGKLEDRARPGRDFFMRTRRGPLARFC
jgi:hypothetical protein